MRKLIIHFRLTSRMSDIFFSEAIVQTYYRTLIHFKTYTYPKFIYITYCGQQNSCEIYFLLKLLYFESIILNYLLQSNQQLYRRFGTYIQMGSHITCFYIICNAIRYAKMKQKPAQKNSKQEFEELNFFTIWKRCIAW